MARFGFGVAATLKLTDVSYRNLDYWAKTGLVRSSIRQAQGKGTRRVYAFEDLVALRLVRRLRDAGVPLQAIRRAVQYLQRHSERPLTTLALVSDGSRILALTEDPRRMVEATAEGQVVVAINVEPIRRTLEASVSRLGAPRTLNVRVHGRSYQTVLTPDLEQGGYGVEVPELPGCFSQGDDVADARSMAKEAIELWLETARSVGARSPRAARI